MKARKIFLCIIIFTASAMLIGGGVLFAAGMGRLDWDFRRLDPIAAESIRTVVDPESQEPLANLVINSYNRAVRLVNAADGALAFNCFDDERISTVYTQSGDTVTITTRNERGWNNTFANGGFWFRGLNSYTTVIGVPDGLNITVNSASGSVGVEGIAAQALTVNGASGSFRVNNVVVDGKLYVRHTSGSVRLNGVEAGEIETRSLSGSLRLENIAAENGIAVSAASGSINMSRLTAGGNISAASTSGSVGVELLTAGGNVEITNGSGRIRVYGLNAGGTLTATGRSGSIRLEGVSAHSISFENGSGSVRVSVRGQQSDFNVNIRCRRRSVVSSADTGRYISGAVRNGTARLEFV